LKISASIKNIGNSKVEILAYLTTEEEMKRLSKKSLKVDYFGRPSAVYIVSFYKEDSLKSCSSELICYC
jgi:acylphosphatase